MSLLKQQTHRYKVGFYSPFLKWAILLLNFLAKLKFFEEIKLKFECSASKYINNKTEKKLLYFFPCLETLLFYWTIGTVDSQVIVDKGEKSERPERKRWCPELSRPKFRNLGKLTRLESKMPVSNNNSLFVSCF